LNTSALIANLSENQNLLLLITFWLKPKMDKSFIWKRQSFRGGARMDTEEMLEIVETRAWIPKKKPDKENPSE
jgi:hypothetical protein